MNMRKLQELFYKIGRIVNFVMLGVYGLLVIIETIRTIVDAVNGNCECSGFAGQIRAVRVLFRESNVYCHLVSGMCADQLLLECVDERL